MIEKYPYTDFNEYNLDWIITTVKDLSVQWTQTRQDFTEINDAWEDMKSYIENYFNNLDVQTEINNKINEMVSDGTFYDIFHSTLEEQAATTTGAWIAANLLQETGYVIDRSLTVQNAAADAKTVGDKISIINNNIYDFTGNEFIPVATSGYISLNADPISLTPVSAAGYKCTYIECSEGDQFYIKGSSLGSGARLYSFVDSDLTRLLTSIINFSTSDYIKIEAPENTRYLVVNNYDSTVVLCKNAFLVDRVKNTEKFCDLYMKETIPVYNWKWGGVVPNTGELGDINTRLRVELPYSATKIGVDSGYSYALFAWDSENNYVGWYYNGSFVKDLVIVWRTQELDISEYSDYKLKMVIRYASTDTRIPFSDYDKAYIIALTDIYLLNKNKIADSFAAGEILNKIRILYISPAYYAADDSQLLVSDFTTLISMYDDLVSENPYYITKNTLTHDSFTNYEYVFSMGNYNSKQGQRTQDAEISKPVILIMAGIHGYEKSSIMGLYLFAKALCESPSMSSIKDGYIVKIIPVACPWGFDNNSRLNSNGVNINRNFDADWIQTPEGSDYSGETPADQDETQVIQDWMDSNTDAAILIDWHNSAYTNEITYFGTCDSSDFASKAKKGYFEGIGNIIDHWVKDRNIDANNIIYSYTGIALVNGSAENYAKKINANGTLLETSWSVGTYGKDTVQTIGVNAEAITAIVKGVIAEL